MKRLHVHVSVEDLAQSIGFYSTLFAADPTVRKPDYAKWMLDDPRVNFAISQRGAVPGIDRHGGAPGTRDLALLEMGCARAMNLFAYGEPTLEQLAAVGHASRSADR